MLCFYLLAPGSTPFDTKTGFACYQGLIQRHDWRISPSCGTSFLEPLVPPYNARGFCLFPQREGKHLAPAAGLQERQEWCCHINMEVGGLVEVMSWLSIVYPLTITL